MWQCPPPEASPHPHTAGPGRHWRMPRAQGPNSATRRGPPSPPHPCLMGAPGPPVVGEDQSYENHGALLPVKNPFSFRCSSGSPPHSKIGPVDKEASVNPRGWYSAALLGKAQGRPARSPGGRPVAQHGLREKSGGMARVTSPVTGPQPEPGMGSQRLCCGLNGAPTPQTQVPVLTPGARDYDLI